MTETRYVRPSAVTYTYSTNPGTEYFSTAQDRMRVDSGQAISYLRFIIPPLAPAEQLSAAYLEVTDELTHTAAYTAQRVDNPTLSFRAINWNNDPGTFSGSSSVAGVRTGRLTRFSVATDAAVGGTIVWRVTSADTATRWLLGPRKATGYPRLVLEVQTGPVTPTDVTPQGNIGVAAPTVQWTEQAGVDKVQVAAAAVGATWSAASGFSSPTWTSAEIVTTDGLVNTSTAGWAGIANTASAAISVRQHVVGGWSNWSQPVTITRVNKPTVTITNPTGATTEDGTPPVTWTVSGGTQSKWMVSWAVTRAGVQVASGNSGMRAGTDLLWALPSGATVAGDVLTVSVFVYDNVTRALSPGDAAYVRADQTVTYTPSASVTAVSTVDVTVHSSGAPIAQVAWTRGALPDWVDMQRNGTIVDRLEPDENPWVDWSTPPNVSLTYRPLAGVSPATASTGPTETIRMEVEGLWIIDPATSKGFRLAGQELSIVYGDVTGVYTAVTADELVTRVAALRGAEGSMQGLLDEWTGRTIEQQIEDVWFLRANPREVRLIAGNLNIPVTYRTLYTVFDTELSTTDDMKHLVRFDFAQPGRELPWEV
jgi:hypothetical protein